MIYSVEITEERIGNIDVEAKTQKDAAFLARELYNEDPEQNVDWYSSEATFDGMTEEDLLHEKKYMEWRDYSDEHYVEMFDACVCCGAIIPEGSIICPDCAAGSKGDEENEGQECDLEQREPQSGRLACGFRRRISRLFGQ